MRILTRWFYCFILSVFSLPGWGLTITHEPYIDPSILKKEFAPIVTYLNTRGFTGSFYLGAKNFKDYYLQAEQHQFDLIITSTMHANILIERFSYIPILVRDTELRCVVVTLKGNDIETLNDLMNKTVLSPSPFDAIAQLGRNLLGDIRANIVTTNNIASVVVGILKGEAEAGFMAETDLLLVKRDMRNRLAILTKSDAVDYMYLLLSPKQKNNMEKIKRALLELNQSPLMEEITKTHGFNAFLPLDSNSRSTLNKREKEVKAVLKELQMD